MARIGREIKIQHSPCVRSNTIRLIPKRFQDIFICLFIDRLSRKMANMNIITNF